MVKTFDRLSFSHLLMDMNINVSLLGCRASVLKVFVVFSIFGVNVPKVDNNNTELYIKHF